MSGMQNVILVGGKFAGAKMQVPEGKTIINIPDPKPHLAIVNSMKDVQAMYEEVKAKGASGVQHLADCDNPYILHPIMLGSATFNDVVSFTIGCPPGMAMSDAFFDILAGYTMVNQFSFAEAEPEGER